MPEKRPESKVTLFKSTRKADTAMVVNTVFEIEDDFHNFYSPQTNAGPLIIEPPFNPSTLIALVTRNNVLSQCVDAMVVNVDGTGFTIEPTDPEKKGNEKEKDKLEGFFNEPFPMWGFIEYRRQLRRDLESTGNGYLEVLRNLGGEIIFVRYMEAKMMRLVKLDEPVEVDVELDRNGEKVKAKIWTRERRYVQKIGTQMIFFKEFGASRNLNRETGYWEGDEKLPPEKLASEVLHFTLSRDASTPYGIPRWVNQLPSVLGSRKAEEFNLDFFDAGGIPPAAIFIQGGALAAEVTEQLRTYFGPKNKDPHRVAVVEVQSTSGTIDSPGSVQVKVERFGDSKAGDALFQNYDAKCEEHVRVAFRLPPLFIGRAQDYNFATAMTSYMVTELQVFQPERTEFDEVINRTIVHAMGISDWKFVSKPMILKNVDVQVKAIELAKDKLDGEDFVEELNNIAGLSMEFSEEAEEKAAAAANPMQAPPDGEQGKPPVPGEKPKLTMVSNEAKPKPKEEPAPIKKAEDMTPVDIVQLVAHWSRAMKLEKSEVILTTDERDHILKTVDSLSDTQRKIFDNILASKAFVNVSNDPHGLGEIAGCCSKMMG